jgi:hypothetical protein
MAAYGGGAAGMAHAQSLLQPIGTMFAPYGGGGVGSVGGGVGPSMPTLAPMGMMPAISPQAMWMGGGGGGYGQPPQPPQQQGPGYAANPPGLAPAYSPAGYTPPAGYNPSFGKYPAS